MSYIRYKNNNLFMENVSVRGLASKFSTPFYLYSESNIIENYNSFSQQSASIINIGSLYGIVSPDFRIYGNNDRKNSEIYGATKAGIIQITKYLAVYLAQ